MAQPVHTGPGLAAHVLAYSYLERDAFSQSKGGALLRAAAIRFWLSRLYDLHLPRAAELNTPHDPAVFENILRLRIAKPGFWPTNLDTSNA